MSSLLYPIFIWSLPNEPGFVDAYRQHHRKSLLVPMTPDTARTARAFFDEEEVLDPSSLFGSGDRQAIDLDVIAFENALRKALRAHSKPWIRSLCFDTTRMACDSTFYTWEIMSRLRKRCDFDYAKIYPSFTKLYQPLHRRVEEFILKASIADMHNTAWEPVNKRRVRKMLLKARQVLGCLVNRCGSLLMAESIPVNKPAGKVDVVVAGLLRTDVHAQSTLVNRLAEERIGSVAWFSFTGGSLTLSRDESLRGGASKPDMIEVPQVERHRWRLRALDALSKENLVVDLQKVIERVGLNRPDMPPHASRILAAAIVEFHPQLRLVYHSVADLMESASPRAIVANCNVGMMAFAREWARETKTRYVKIPHAFQYDPTYHYEWDADRLGVLGPWLGERINREALPHVNMCVVGGADLSEQAMACRIKASDRQSEVNVCYLLSELGRSEYPDIESEIETDTLGLARACSRIGKQLAVRCHPRSKIKWFYDKLCKQGTDEGAACIMLDAQQSLTDQLGESIAAVIRITSSSAVMALYLRIPIIGFVPRPGRTYSDEFLECLPLHAHTGDEVAELINRLATDEAFMSSVLEQQDAFLAELIEDPRRDPYDRSIEMIRESLASA